MKSKDQGQIFCLQDSSRRLDRAKCGLSLAKIYIHFASQCFLNQVTHLQHAALDMQQSEKHYHTKIRKDKQNWFKKLMHCILVSSLALVKLASI